MLFRSINRVTKVTKGGRTFSFAAIVVVGNEDGVVGWGLGKAGEVTTAIAKGVEAAKKNLVKVPVLKGTIPHEQVAKFGGAEVLIKPASHGTGVKAGGAMRLLIIAEILEANHIETEIFHIGNRPIGGCIACGTCSKSGRCITDDSVNVALQKSLTVDGLDRKSVV